MTTIYWAGDSTVKQNTMATWPQTGVGQAFERFVKPREMRVENHAENGRSTKSFIDEGRLAPIYDRITRGDFLFIQFGHNDEKPEDPARYADPDSGFPENLTKFVSVARNKGAIPVLITPVARYNRNGPNAKYHHDRWAAATIKLGRELDVAVIDLTRLSEALVDRLGETARVNYYMNLPAGKYPHFPQGQTDNTHLQPEGALAFAEIIARELKKLGGPYAALLSDDFDQYCAEADNFGLAHTAHLEVEL